MIVLPAFIIANKQYTLPPLTSEEAVFIVEQLNNIRILLATKALNIRGGSSQLHFDADNNIRKVDFMYSTVIKH